MSFRARAVACLVLMAPVAASAQALEVWRPPAQPAAATPAANAAAPVASAAAMPEAASKQEDDASAPAAMPIADAAPAAASVTSATAANALIGPAPEDKGQIVFYREPKFAGGAIGFKVREGDAEIGKLRSGNYFVALVEPGRHEYNVKGETRDILPIEVEAGETYYVKTTVSMGILAGRPNLAPSDATNFLAVSKKLKLAK